MNRLISGFAILAACSAASAAHSQDRLAQYDLQWETPSRNSGENMPVGGGDVGVNVWAEGGDLLLYLDRSGNFDENNTQLKSGRIRIRLSPNPLADPASFRQRLHLRDGYVSVTTASAESGEVRVRVWVEVFQPVAHVEIESERPIEVSAQYESWRTEERPVQKRGAAVHKAIEYMWYPGEVITRADSVRWDRDRVLFYHRNRDSTAFDVAVATQHLSSVREALWNPLRRLTFGGTLVGEGFVADGYDSGAYQQIPYRAWRLRSREPRRRHHLAVVLHTAQTETLEGWSQGLVERERQVFDDLAARWNRNLAWWNEYWERSYIQLNPDKPDPTDSTWQVGRNYQLFRYLLGANAYGAYPTKFNGSLFTVDPLYGGLLEHPRADKDLIETPDFRMWGGGSFTAQNQRLVYWPMLKSGDFDLMPSQFDFYRNALGAAETRTRVYWGHEGASFTEQISQFGLPLTSHYGWDRADTLDVGEQDNRWVVHHYTNQLEFALMILDYERFSDRDISPYLPFVKSAVRFFDEHYQLQHRQRTGEPLDRHGKLVIFPSTAAETYKIARNPSDVISGLTTVTRRLLELPESSLDDRERSYFAGLLGRLPEIPFRTMNGRRTIAPAESFEVQLNTELPQMYPVFPYGLFGLGKPDLQVALDTWRYGYENENQKGYVSWRQDGIFAARLGLTEEARAVTLKKLTDSGRRFPAYFGPGNDWAPDHNWGGSGMIGLQEMLMQTDGRTILLMPAWPPGWDADFKLHAPYRTVVEGRIRGNRLVSLKVTPEERAQDVQLPRGVRLP
jgi:hypothetical protein